MTDGLNQAEHEQISTSLEVEQIEVNLFRSKSLWLPKRARGVFGGQVISQAVVSATNCVDPAYALHSLHCYFLTSASASTPIVYSVERVREGKSYVTRAVKAIQNGQIVFTMLCSFQKPEPWQPSYQWPMPEVPPPDECPNEGKNYELVLNNPESSQNAVRFTKERLDERKRSPVDIRMAKEHETSKDGRTIRYIYWMKARSIPQYEAPFQKCILAYISDMHFINSATQTIGLRRGVKGPKGLGMNSTVDHSIWFYDNDFHAGDWLLYEMVCPRVGSGRGIAHGRMFTRDGVLVAVTSQEGVVRANIRAPGENTKSKL